MLSSLRYASFCNYSPYGQSDLSKQSRTIRDKAKAGKINFEKVIPYLQKPSAEVILPFLDNSVTFVPVPRSHPVKEGSLWPSLVIAQELHRFGYGSGIETLLNRTSIIRKSATAGRGNRPTVKEHYATLAVEVERDLFKPTKITLIDDVITKGSTILACANHLQEQFPDAEIQAFAFIRTQGLIEDIALLVDPSTGIIPYNKLFDEGDRKD